MVKYRICFRSFSSDKEYERYRDIKVGWFSILGNGIGSRNLEPIEVFLFQKVIEMIDAGGFEDEILNDLVYYYRTGDVMSHEIEARRVICELYGLFITSVRSAVSGKEGFPFLYNVDKKCEELFLSLNTEIDYFFSSVKMFNDSLELDIQNSGGYVSMLIIGKILDFIRDNRDDELVTMIQCVFFRERAMAFHFDDCSFQIFHRKYKYDVASRIVLLDSISEVGLEFNIDMIPDSQKVIMKEMITTMIVRDEKALVIKESYEEPKSLESIVGRELDNVEEVRSLDHLLSKISFPRNSAINLLFYRVQGKLKRVHCVEIYCRHHVTKCAVIIYSAWDRFSQFIPIMRCKRKYQSNRDMWESIYSEVVGKYKVDGTNLIRNRNFDWSAYSLFLGTIQKGRNHVRFDKVRRSQIGKFKNYRRMCGNGSNVADSNYFIRLEGNDASLRNIRGHGPWYRGRSRKRERVRKL